MSIYNILLGSAKIVIPGSITFATPGDYYWTPVNYNVLTVEIWGGGGTGGDSAAQYATGAGGGGGAYTRWDIPIGALGTSEHIYVGNGGYNNGQRYGDYSVFGDYAWASGGYGGYDYSSGSNYYPLTYSPPSGRSFTQTYSENGAGGGLIGHWNGYNATYAGGGGAAETSVTNQSGTGGTSTYGGAGGNSGAAGNSPGGGSGATNTGFAPHHVNAAGSGQVKLTWV